MSIGLTISFTMAFCVVYYYIYIYVAKEVRGIVVIRLHMEKYNLQIFFCVEKPLKLFHKSISTIFLLRGETS